MCNYSHDKPMNMMECSCKIMCWWVFDESSVCDAFEIMRHDNCGDKTMLVNGVMYRIVISC